jgi:methionyl-tRNA synthetase
MSIEHQEDAEKTFITIDDFIKVEMNVGQIKECEPLEGSSKLYKLVVDLGLLGKRQVLAGIAKFYAPEELIGRKGSFVTNLAPRQMAGSVSEAMIMCAKDNDGNFCIVAINPQIANGTRLS